MVKELQLIDQLKAADVLVAKKRNGFGRVLNHFVVYVGDNTFIGNLENGVKLLSINKLEILLVDYEPIRINYFKGSEYERELAVNRAFSKIGQEYNLLKFNCEHYANYVQKGTERSIQVIIAFLLAIAIVFKLIKLSTNGKR